MVLRQQILKNIYRDSVALMQVAAEVERMPGVGQATLVMATPGNLELSSAAGLTDGTVEAGPNDLLIAVGAESEKALDDAFELVQERLQDRSSSDRGGESDWPAPPVTLEMALREYPGADLALISCPGAYATAEAMKALRLGLHVMIFSDNVALADEIALKTFARDNDLMMMGPDCGTAIINGVPLGFANATRPGPVGVVAASGTGLQQVVCLLDRREIGISQAIGTGGRDLEADVGGITMIQGLRALSADEATRVIVLVSKPPHPDVARNLIDEARSCRKPVVVNFLGMTEHEAGADTLSFADTLEGAAMTAAALVRGTTADAGGMDAGTPLDAAITEPLSRLGEGQVNLRGLYSGGSFCYEAQLLLRDGIGPVWSHTPLDANFALPDPQESKGHTVIDLGDDRFTQGRPHPMIDQRTRNRRLLQEAVDPTTAVILFDVVLGYGAHGDPASEIADAVREARALAGRDGRALIFVAFVCGTERDPQNLSEQEAKLCDAGVFLAPSNAGAVGTVSRIMAEIGRGG